MLTKSFALFCLLITVLLITGLAEAQQAKKISTIGYLSAADRMTDASRAEGIRRALRELGYIEGDNIVIEYRYAEGKGVNSELAGELVRLKVELILVAGGDGGIQAATHATKTIPIVLTGFGSDSVRAGFIQSLARPGGNVTGLTGFSRELGGKRLELLKEAIPKLAHVAVLYDPSVPRTAREVSYDLPAAARAEVDSSASGGTSYGRFDRVFAALTKARPGGLYAPAAAR